MKQGSNSIRAMVFVYRLRGTRCLPQNLLKKLFEHFQDDSFKKMSYFLDFVQNLFASAGFEVIENKYIHKRTVNKKEGVDVPRIFLQGKFKKPV